MTKWWVPATVVTVVGVTGASLAFGLVHHHGRRSSPRVAHSATIASPAPSRTPTTRTLWVLAASHFDQVAVVPGVRALLRTGVVYEPITVRQERSTLVSTVPTADFHSEALLASAIAHHRLARGVEAVIYDNERFATTPAVEQANIVRFTKQAATVAAAVGLQSICDFIQPDRLPPAERNPAYEVPDCSMIGLNTVQQSERSVAAYDSVVRREVEVIRSVRPRVPIIAGLSANPRGAPVTAVELSLDMETTATLVNGYWLHVPAPGIGCPACHAPDPGLLAQALADLPHGFHTAGS